MVRIIGIASGKGGVGKTVTVANLGTVLASHFNKNVVVVDCNLTNPHLALHLGGFSGWPVTLNDVLKNRVDIKEAVHTHSSGLRVVPASFDQKDLKENNMYKLKSRIRSLFKKQKADIVLLDSSPGLSRDSFLTLRCSDEVYFVATPHIPSIVDITKCYQMLGDEDAVPEGIILNRVKGHRYELRDNEIEQFTSLPIVAKIPEDSNVLKSTNFKVPVVTMNPKSRASRAYFQLGSRIAGEEYIQRIGFFEKLKEIFRK